MLDSRSESFVELRDLILEYLRQHPHAADTLEGIASWWVNQRQVSWDLYQVEEVLERLVEEGRIAKQIGREGAVRYSASSNRDSGDGRKEGKGK
jgi:hypothetical protein